MINLKQADKNVKTDFYGRKFYLPAAGAFEPVINEIWSYRSYNGETEANIYPMPD